MSALQEIGYFSITDKNLAETNKALAVRKEILALPINSALLNVGSGIYRLFESEVYAKRPDLTICSIDPTLGIASVNGNEKHTEPGFQIFLSSNSTVSYRLGGSHSPMPDVLIYKDKSAVEYDRNRKKILTNTPGATAALATALPFKSDCFKLIIDNMGPMLFLESSTDKMKYLLELKRVLHKDGSMYVSSLDEDKKAMLNDIDMEYRRTGSKFIESYIISNRSERGKGKARRGKGESVFSIKY
jgi:hypothetical protein